MTASRSGSSGARGGRGRPAFPAPIHGAVFSGQRPPALQAGFVAWVGALLPEAPARRVARAGKTGRRPDGTAPAGPLGSAGASEARRRLAQRARKEKRNEIT